ncbi:MAG: hypothetical protein ACYCOO_06925 [Chitinophagaceae bacterium]
MKPSLLIIALLLILSSCKKNTDFTNIPQITFKSVNTTVIHFRDPLIIDFGFRDGPGNIQDTVFFKKSTFNFYQAYPIPNFPVQKNVQGTITLTLDYFKDIGQPQNPNIPDTAFYSIYIRDLSGHNSDTIQTPQIIIYSN